MLDLLYTIIMGLVGAYRKLHLLVICVLIKPVKLIIKKTLNEAGIAINGNKPSDIQIKNPKFYQRIANEQTIGLGESYMDGWWDCEKLDELCNRLTRAGMHKFFMKFPDYRFINYLQFNLFNLQTAKRSFEVAVKHYDLGNTLYESFLDETMNYSCGYWKDAQNLNQAQKNKMELIGKKLKLKAGMKVLDIGCGWGGLCKYLAETYDVAVVGITISKEGARAAKELCKDLPVDIRVEDYRQLDERFDRIVSVGMFEHVGRKNYRTFFKLAHRCLRNEGIFLCHTIGVDNDDISPVDPWLIKYIFPNGTLPDHRNITENIHNLFTIEDWHNFGADYDKTLMAWHSNFVKNWSKISHMFYEPERFFRMWSFYLLASAGVFRSRKCQLWQVVLSKGGISGGYESVR